MNRNSWKFGMSRRQNWNPQISFLLFQLQFNPPTFPNYRPKLNSNPKFSTETPPNYYSKKYEELESKFQISPETISSQVAKPGIQLGNERSPQKRRSNERENKNKGSLGEREK